MRIDTIAASVFILFFACVSAATAEPMEVQTPDGQTVILYPDRTWEYKRPPPTPEGYTVELDAGAATSFRMDGEHIVSDRPGYRPIPATHSVRNVGANTFREVLIEFKNGFLVR